MWQNEMIIPSASFWLDIVKAVIDNYVVSSITRDHGWNGPRSKARNLLLNGCRLRTII